MMKKRILSLVLLFALIIALVSCFGKPKNFPIDLGSPVKLFALSPINSASYGTEDSEKVKKLVDMLNACTYEKYERDLLEFLEHDVNYGLYNPWDVTFAYKNGDDLYVRIYLEGYMCYYYEPDEVPDIYKISGFDKEIFCDAIGLSLSAVKEY